MTQLQLPMDTETFIQNRFSEVGIEIQSIERKDYPGESIFVYIPPKMILTGL